MNAAFFGHKDAPESIYPVLRREITELIEKNDDIGFFAGTHGAFDRMVRRVLAESAENYPNMRYYIILAYLPTDDIYKDLPTIYPEGIENVPKRFAIDFRNNYMVDKCDTVICYIKYSGGCAEKYVEKARRKGKRIINLADMMHSGKNPL